ncbi:MULTISPECIES: isoprenylcysteine carboxylmethyltransferase family protein [unclassified Haloferax]|jgi:protein-S-isoprenylcysteine O-methyltransferase Ste14|uniref:methyltransferase family protein n=1 Tax=unclassified Haloferax TaxID=2625095 RepID=UPI0018F66727|nr:MULTISPECIES: isoprenylcysteine carboxylmethyltransferase family protein [unclassified Haloferax]MDS0243800.1 isoprenylcysteine carboxylmethyltransferase family protein [Haloferax sp. S2CR25]MDS0446921.1 isoprenylcysteine carboxylmethyltransferase family protein [Haloferax sp. S2CR25-2]
MVTMPLVAGITGRGDAFGHSGAWALALIAIVVVSWLFYRYFAPQRWREWAGAGVVQAFIIALYAEMFGFPLTIYLLVRYFGLDRAYVSANLWSTLVGVGETGMIVSMLLGYAVAFIGVGFFIQGWKQVYRARQEDRLTTDGLYRFVRHPQYTGLFIALFGEGIIHWPTIFSVGLFPVVIVTFAWLARKEEREMLDQFGNEYRTYQRNVPMFVPRRDQWRRFVGESRFDPDQ